MGGRSKRQISEAELSRWRLIEQFEQRLERASAATEEPRTFNDPRRKLSQKDYLSLLLFALFNPVVDSMRGLCAASRLSRVRQQVCSGGVSLGSFSEAQAVIDPALLQRVFAELAAEPIQREGSLLDGRLERYRQGLLVVDSTLWRALPRMAWALWRYQHGRESGLRLQVKFNLWQDQPVAAQVSSARQCERALLRSQLKEGEFYIGDRYYGEDYALFSQLEQAGCSYLLRLRQEAVFEAVESWPLSAADQRASVTFDGLVRLGTKKQRSREPLRLVRVQTDRGELLLVSNKQRQELSAELLAEIYRHRWRVELFFKWLKCILGCRHWLAESERGVALQIYCALIAALLLLRYSGRRPSKRAMEMIRFYLLGYATLEELSATIAVEKKAA
jgi:DDE family transposase